MEHTMGRVTIPTDMDVVKETLELAKKWGADAVRDCDGTDFPKELKDAGLKVYATYYTTRKDNAFQNLVYILITDGYLLCFPDFSMVSCRCCQSQFRIQHIHLF